jgi:hypothetical protein
MCLETMGPASRFDSMPEARVKEVKCDGHCLRDHSSPTIGVVPDTLRAPDLNEMLQLGTLPSA